MANSKIFAQGRARAIIENYGVSEPPVPIEKIAKSLGITIQYAPFDDALSGMAFVKDGISIIGVNALHHPNRQRFTIAHELGHHVLHAELLQSGVHVDKVVLNRDKMSAQGLDIKEVQANAFAAEILMPSAWIDDIINDGVDVSDETRIAALAKIFKVSTAALQFRIMA